MSKARNDGKALEKVVRLIQETLKDRPATLVHSNYRIKNSSGQLREFDVFIETKVNDITIHIAIECKSYNSRIPVEKVEAFKGKCERIPTINKKIFVAENGYQADALNAARDFGIDLFDLKALDKNEVLNWLPIGQVGLVFTATQYKLVVDTTDDELKKLDSEVFAHLYFGDSTEPKPISQVVIDLVKQSSKELWSINLYEFMKNGGSKSIGKRTIIPVSIGLDRGFILSKSGVRYPVPGIEASIESWLEEKVPKINAAQVYATTQGQTSATHISVDLGERKEQAHVVITKEKTGLFLTDEEGQTTELKVLAKYNAATDTFENLS